jgi:hypothetical protein
LAARRAPGAAALAVVALTVVRDMAAQRAPGAATQSVIVLVALFLSEAGAPGRCAVCWRRRCWSAPSG